MSNRADPSRVRFDPAAVARYSNKVEVDTRYRADANVVRKKRPALDDLMTGLKEDKEFPSKTTNTKTLPATKRAYNDISNNNKANDTIFSLPSFKKQKTTPEPSSKTAQTNLKSPNTTKPSTSTIKTTPKPQSNLTSKPNVSTNSKPLNPKPTTTTTRPLSTTSTLQRPTSNGTTTKASYASVTSKSYAAVTSKSLSKPATPGTKLPTTGSKPPPPTSKAGSKLAASKVPPPSSSSSKPRAKAAPAPAINRYPIAKVPATLSGFPTKVPPTSKPAQGHAPPRNTTLQTLPNKSAGPPGSRVPLSKVQNGKLQRPRQEYNEYEYDPIADREELGEEESFWNNNYSSAIRDIFKRKHKYAPIQYSDAEDDVKETGFLDWEEEEQRSEAAGAREDRAEFMSEKKRKLAKQKKIQAKSDL